MIPQPIDKKLAALDDMAASVLVCLRILKNNPRYDRRQLEERLRAFNAEVLSIADDLIANG